MIFTGYLEVEGAMCHVQACLRVVLGNPLWMRVQEVLRKEICRLINPDWEQHAGDAKKLLELLAAAE